MRSSYVTTPIYYVNDLPHIGHIYTTVVADTVARYWRMRGDRVRFLTGTDEHGQKIEEAAQARGMAPIELADRVVSRYHELWSELGISHDDFVRTTEARHRRAVEGVVERIDASGDLYVDTHEGWYCVGCETFYTEKELLAGNVCPVHERPAERRSEENVFFRLSKYQDRLLELYDSDPPFVRPEGRLNEVRQFVASGLRDLSVSRGSVSWGIPFPGHDGQTVYVWLDALTNYVSALGFGGEDDSLYRDFWEDAATRLHLVGKDILRFHAVYWPAFLMSAGLPLPTTVFAHGWWLRDEKKMSKSGGNVVRPDHLVAAFGTDPLRFFLLREMSFGHDASFSDEAFLDCFNSYLSKDLGNTVSRVATLARRAFGGRTPPRGPAAEGRVREVAVSAIRDWEDAMERLAFHRAIEALWRLLGEINQYLVAREPWKLMKDPARTDDVAEVLANCLEALRIVGTGLLPILPERSRDVLRAIGAPVVEGRDGTSWGAGFPNAVIPEVEGLFPRIDKDAVLASWTQESDGGPAVTEKTETEKTESEEKTGGASEGVAEEPAPEEPRIDFEAFMAVKMVVGTVRAAEPIPKSNKLLRLTVDLGEPDARTVVAGIAKAYAPEDLVGTQVVVVANLKPAKLMGVESNGMVLAASEGGRPVVLRPAVEVPAGTEVR